MLIHLPLIDVESLIESAKSSVDLSDEGESFSEEAHACLSEEEIEEIEEQFQGSIEDFFISVFKAWDEGEPEDIPVVLMDALAELGIEMTFDDPSEVDLDDEWDDEYDRELEDDEDEEEF